MKHTNSKGREYFLHTKEVVLRGGVKHNVFYFAKVAGENVVAELPVGYEVIENGRSGLPLLRKVRAEVVTTTA